MWANQQYSADWALNPSAYKNVSHEDVDWASLAQQWIKMKEATTALITPPPPPSTNVDKNDEKGEAPMDMETDEKPSEGGDPSTWGNWPGWQQSWGWNWAGGAPSEQENTSSKDSYGYTSTFTPGDNSGTIDYNHGTTTSNQPVYWTGQASGAPDVSSQKDSKTYTRNSRYSWRRSERERDREKDRYKERDSKDDDDTAETLDAAKRKQLPLWIREGLEKMEREKQRKIDKEKSDKERAEYLRIKKEEDEQALAKMDSVEAAKFMARSKFDSDGSDREEEKVPVVKQRKSRFQDEGKEEASAPPLAEVKREKSKTPPPIEPPKTREELLEDLMLNVRRTLTEILLDITTEEIEGIARQVYQNARSKAPAKRLRKSQAFASIAAKSGLGLGIYGSDDDSDSDDSSSSTRQPKKNSDDELDEVIRQKKECFAKTEADIEAELAAEDEKERERLAAQAVHSSEDESDEVGQVERATHDHESKNEALKSRSVDEEKRRRKVSESELSRTETLKEDSAPGSKKTKNDNIPSDSSSSSTSNSSKRKKKLKKKKRRSSSGEERISKKKSSSSNEDERIKKKSKKKKKRENDDNSLDHSSNDGNESEPEPQRRKHKNHDHEKRHKKSRKADKDGKRDDEKVKKSSRRSVSRSSDDHGRGRKRSLSLDSEPRTRRRSRSKESGQRKRQSLSREEYRRRRSRSHDSVSRRGRSRSRDFEYRRRRSRSKESYRRKRSKSRESNYRRRRSRSKNSDRKHARRRERSSS